MNPDMAHMDWCPFCGGNPFVGKARVGTSDLEDVWVECYQCGARSPGIRTGVKKTVNECIAEATTAWNRRYWK